MALSRAIHTVSVSKGFQNARVRRIETPDLPVPVVGLDVVGEGLGLLGGGVAVAVVVVGVGVLLGSDVVQLDDVAALVAALDGALTGDLQGKS